MNCSRILQRHNRHGGLCHNSPRLRRVIRNVCIAAGDSGGWWHPIHPSDIGMNIMRIMSVDPYDLYREIPAPQGKGSKSYIRGDIRFRMSLLQQFLMLVLMLIRMLVA